MLPDPGMRGQAKKGSTMRIRFLPLIAGVMMLGSACATAPPPPPPSVDVSGTWEGNWEAFESSAGGGGIRGVFRQDGATLYGNFEIQTQGPNPISRTYVSGVVRANQIQLLAPNEGLLVVDGNEMSGTLQGIMAARVKLRRQP
jgi:hypothetical protein